MSDVSSTRVYLSKLDIALWFEKSHKDWNKTAQAEQQTLSGFESVQDTWAL